MKTPRFLIVMSLAVLAAASLACALFPLPGARRGDQAQATTAAVETRLQQIIGTEAAQMFASTSTQAAALASAIAAGPTPAPPTDTPPPSPTFTQIPAPTFTLPPSPLPPSATPTELPTVTPTMVLVAGPLILFQVDANCRAGPSLNYAVISYMTAGDTSRVYGSDTYRNWWFISDPYHPGEFCWAAKEPTIVKGDTYRVPIVAAAEPQNLVFDGEQNKYWCDPFSSSALACCYASGTCYTDQLAELDCVLWGNCMPTTGSLYFRQFGCPAVTCVNQANYCKNYPKCCGVEKFPLQ